MKAKLQAGGYTSTVAAARADGAQAAQTTPETVTAPSSALSPRLQEVRHSRSAQCTGHAGERCFTQQEEALGQGLENDGTLTY